MSNNAFVEMCKKMGYYLGMPDEDIPKYGIDQPMIWGLLSDEAIKTEPGLVIKPFHEGPCTPNSISYGLTSFGYDLRLGTKYKVFTNARCTVIDPKNFDNQSFIDVEGDYCLIPPNSFALAESVEHLELPRQVMGICVGKSTIARCGLSVPITPIEPSYFGKITIEISNTTPLPAKVYSNEGICQIVFFKSPYPVRQSYADKKGKYQGQTGLTLPLVK